MGGRIPSPKNVHALIPGTSGYINLCDQRDFVGVIKDMALEMGGASWMIWWPNLITGVLKSRETLLDRLKG